MSWWAATAEYGLSVCHTIYATDLPEQFYDMKWLTISPTFKFIISEIEDL